MGSRSRAPVAGVLRTCDRVTPAVWLASYDGGTRFLQRWGYERLGFRLDGETATHHVMVATSYPDE